MANSPLLKIPLLSSSQAGKEQTINTMISYLERSMNDAMTLPFAGGNLTLPEVDLARYFMFKVAGAGVASVLTIEKIKRMFVIDNTASGSAVTVSCTSDTLAIPAGGIVIAYCDGVNLISVADSTVMGGGGGGATNFLSLLDTPNSFSGAPKFVLRVKNDLTGIEFHQPLIADSGDVDLTGLADGYILKWSTAASKFIAVSAATGIPTSENVFWKSAVDCASTEPLALADITVGFTIDTVTLTNDSEILLKDQTDKSENGIYYFEAGVLTRRPDAADATDLPLGAAVAVAGGGQNALQIFFVSNLILSMTDDIEFGASVPAVSLLGLPDVDASIAPTTNQVLTWDVGGAKFKDAQGVYPPLAGQAGKVLTVNPAGNAILWASAGASSYPDMAGNAGKLLAVNSGETDAEWVTAPTELPALIANNGKVLAVKADASGVEWISPPAPPTPVRTIVTKTASATLVLAEASAYIRMNAATALTLTIPLEATEAFPIGTEIPVRQVGAGQVTFAPVSGAVTINTAETLKLRKAGSTASLIKVAANVWDLVGDLVAA